MISTPNHQENNAVSHFLSRHLSINWEVIVYLVIFFAAIFTRFYILGDRVMSHDESLHTRFSYNLYADGNFQHTPLMHGPILFHMTALNYYLFGANDFTSRIYPALLGVIMVMFPLLFRRWLGKWGAILASVMLLISPLLLYYNRYIRHDTPSILAGMLMAYCILMYLNGPANQRRRAHWLYIFAAAMIWNLGSKETAFIYIAIFGTFLFLYWLTRLAQYRYDLRGKPIFYTLMIGILLGGVLTLAMYIIVDIIPVAILPGRGTAWSELSGIEQLSFIRWLVMAIFAIFFTTIGTAIWAFRGHLNRIPWREVIMVLVIAMIVGSGLLFFEELSHFTAPTETAQPVVPGEEATPEVVTVASSMSWMPMIAVWVIAIAAIGFIAFNAFSKSARQSDKHKQGESSGSGLWAFLYQFPEFDLIIVIGTLILPWATAIVPYAMKASTPDYINLAQSLPEGLYNMLLNIPNVGAPEQIGQVVLGFYAWLPLIVLSTVIGLVWNWQRWLITAFIFYTIFAFFFTSVFTNMAGLATGMVYSLGYWLEQQGVRRGSQPQYYYLLIIMPMYEFLPIIGSVLAMFAGMVGFWKYRQRDLDKLELDRQQQIEALILSDEHGDAIPAVDVEPVDLSELVHAEHHHESEDEFIEFDPIEDGEELDDYAPYVSEAIIKQGQGDADDGRLTKIPFLLFFSWWSILNLVGYSLAGEKMPWLGTHLTTPMIFLSAWYFGGIVRRINLESFLTRGWMLLLVMPLFIITALQVIGAFVAGNPPFAGLLQSQLQQTYAWIGSLLMSVVLGVVIWRIASPVARHHVRQIFAVVVFSLLAFVTFRSAWLASFINYDLPTEFLVYAHAAPAIKWVLNDIEEMSLRMTDGRDLKFAYDNEVSWPYSWYFRDYTSAIFVGANPTVQNLDDAIVVVVGGGNRGKVEPILEDRYLRRDYMRLWWPMQEYFNLSAERVNNALDLSSENVNAAQLRRGMFDIWWSRDYQNYWVAIGKDYDVTSWPVSDRMHVYIRKDYAAQIWSYGVGDGEVLTDMPTEVNLCNANWMQYSSLMAIESSNPPLNRPLDLTIDSEGNIYVAEEYSNRVSVFDSEGNYLRSYGDVAGGSPELTFNRPNGVAISSDGNLLVADTWNYRIKLLNPDGEIITQWGQPGEYGFDAPREPLDAFWGPRDVAVDTQGRVYVTDTGNKRVRVFAFDGLAAIHQFDMGSGGSGPGQLDEPSGLAIHSDGRIFVADTWNRRIAVFASDGTHLNNFTVRGWYNDSVNRPYLALDEARNLLYVTDPDGNRVLIYNPNGECLGSFGQQGEDASAAQFTAISGIATDAEGFVYISDSTAGKIYKFPPYDPPADVPAINENIEGQLQENAGDGSAGEQTEEVDVEGTQEVEARG